MMIFRKRDTFFLCKFDVLAGYINQDADGAQKKCLRTFSDCIYLSQSVRLIHCKFDAIANNVSQNLGDVCFLACLKPEFHIRTS